MLRLEQKRQCQLRIDVLYTLFVSYVLCLFKIIFAKIFIVYLFHHEHWLQISPHILFFSTVTENDWLLFPKLNEIDVVLPPSSHSHINVTANIPLFFVWKRVVAFMLVSARSHASQIVLWCDFKRNCANHHQLVSNITDLVFFMLILYSGLLFCLKLSKISFATCMCVSFHKIQNWMKHDQRWV